jgi:glycosyltransferase involved in cell wall biosynthesis
MRVAIFIPAYNAEKFLGGVVKRMQEIPRRDIIVVDDGSKDRTAEIAKSLGITLLRHTVNRGYGGAQKTAYNYVIKKGYDAVVMVHADGQHDPSQIQDFVKMIKNGYDAVTGTRFRDGNAYKQGMPAVRYFGNLLLSSVTRIVTGLKVSEMHNGYRCYSIAALKAVNFNENSNKYEFDTEMLLRMKSKNMKIGEIPVKTIYSGEKSYLNIYTYGSRVMSVVISYCIMKKYRD